MQTFIQDVYPKPDRLNSPIRCYVHYIQRAEESNQIPRNQGNVLLGLEVIEEMVWVGDTLRYSLAQERLHSLLHFYGNTKISKKEVPFFQERYDLCKRLLAVINGGDRESYIEYLLERQEKNRAELIKKVGIGK